ncbi:LapA family protein [Bacillus chungangensis]|uniref:Uncharacterized membrane protein YciS (DUF1049 family) n=1 Tax=Bacillus chungangensis TaxID=587633 RepID=A0ABT9WU86_9BACI|nr:LapA family protein [Bacillus chungangensis]MDQ0176780.1 uncharacterized membrane protein YciS (DUF1049 family) [Bacillus chungangensis]
MQDSTVSFLLTLVIIVIIYTPVFYRINRRIARLEDENKKLKNELEQLTDRKKKGGKK